MRKKKNAIFKYFEPIDISAAISAENSDSKLVDDDFNFFSTPRKRTHLFLNRFTERAIFDIAMKVGLVSHLAKIGFHDLIVVIDRDEAMIHYLKIYDKKVEPQCLLIDLRLSESRFVPKGELFAQKGIATLDMIVIEWLSAENPRNDFDPTRPQLPGQKKPGLGCLNYLMEMMYIVGREVIKDGFMDIPDHMHGAIMYSRKFKFFNPAHEAILQAILRDLQGHSLLDISWGMITGTIVDARTGVPQVYDPSEQIFPLSRRMKNYFRSKFYRKKFDEIYRKKQYRFEYEKMVQLRNEILKSKSVVEL
ncbi:MAG: hypothetical protein N2316_12705 [Spirochaetes bacterium]|nr:hypothetical protein [Spirochaetota bacterium]